jgi:hypothetical protein
LSHNAHAGKRSPAAALDIFTPSEAWLSMPRSFAPAGDRMQVRGRLLHDGSVLAERIRPR